MADYKTKVHLESTTAGYGTELDVSVYQVLTFNVAGTSTSFTVEVYASIDGETYFPIRALPCDDVDFDYVTSITATGKGYEVNIAPYAKLQIRLTAIGNGNITVPIFMTGRDY